MTTVDDDPALAALSVFKGSFDADAAAAVARLYEAGLEPLLGSGALTRDGERYALAVAPAASVDEDVRRRHLEHYLAVGEWVREVTPGPNQDEAWATLQHERQNLIAAGDYATEAGDAEATVRLARCFQRWFSPPLQMMEHVRRWLTPLLERADLDPPLRASAYGNATLQASLAKDWDETEELGRRALALYRDVGDAEGEAWMLERLADASLARGDDARADELLEQSLAAARRSGTRIMVWAALAQTAQRAIERRDLDHAEQRIDELEAFVATNFPGTASGANTLRGLLALARGETRAALERLLDSLRYLDERDDEGGVAATLRPFAAALAVSGQTQEALVLAAYAETLRDTIAKRRAPSWERYRDVVFANAEAALSAGDVQAARAEGEALTRSDAVARAGRAHARDFGAPAEPAV